LLLPISALLRFAAQPLRFSSSSSSSSTSTCVDGSVLFPSFLFGKDAIWTKHAMRFHLYPEFFCFDAKAQELRIWSCCHGASIISVTRIQGQEFVQPRCSRAEKMASSRSLMRRRSSARSSGLPSSNSTRLQAVGPNANQDSLGRKQIRKSSVPYRQSPIQSSPDAKWPVRLGRRQRPARPARCPSPQVRARPRKFQIREPLARLHRAATANLPPKREGED